MADETRHKYSRILGQLECLFCLAMEQNNEGGGRQGKREIAQMKKCSQNATVTVNDIMEALNNLHRRVEDLTRVCYAKVK